jgi:hypothetical protein
VKEQTLLVLRLLARDCVPGRALVWLISCHREKLKLSLARLFPYFLSFPKLKQRNPLLVSILRRAEDAERKDELVPSWPQLVNPR